VLNLSYGTNSGQAAGIVEMSLTDWDRVIAVNLTATDQVVHVPDVVLHG